VTPSAGSRTGAVAIHAIQGRSHRSPLEGRQVRVTGIVTATVENRSGRMIWIQDPEGDGDSATSEGLATALRADHPEPAVGDVVVALGRVEERGRGAGLTTTTVAAEDLQVVERGRSLVAPVVIGRSGRTIPSGTVDDDGLTVFEPAEDAIDFFESLEGMLLQVEDPIVVGPTSRYGEIAVLPDGRMNGGDRTGNGGLVARPGAGHRRPVVIDDRLVSNPPMVRVGDRLAGHVVGVLDYSFGNFKLLNTEPLPGVVRGGTLPETTELDAGERSLTVATLNVENLSAQSSDDKLARVGIVIARHLRSPDIVALQEVQDDSADSDDGVVTARATLSRLVEAIQTAGGRRYGWRQVDPCDGRDGGAPGANIRMVLLFDPDRLRFVDRLGGGREAEVVGGPALSRSPGLIAPNHRAFVGDPDVGFEGARKPLACELEFAGYRLFVVNLHLISKGSDDPEFGVRQPPQRSSDAQRLEQALVVRAFVEEILDRDGVAAVIVLGDLNDFEYRPPVRRLTGGRLVNLVERVPVDERYSYIFQGISQTLDHIFVSRSLAREAAIDMVHVNADFPAAERASDHDPLVARISFGD
jgi:predicted extracellular nuclease